MSTITHSTTLESVECCHCGMAVGLSKTWLENAHNIGKFLQQFWCPYCGNRQGWGESRHEKELAEAKRQAEFQQRMAKYSDDRATKALAEADHFRRSRDGMKGVLVKERRRVGNGVCPCCNRTFSNLQRHMKSEHPDHAANLISQDSPANSQQTKS